MNARLYCFVALCGVIIGMGAVGCQVMSTPVDLQPTETAVDPVFEPTDRPTATADETIPTLAPDTTYENDLYGLHFETPAGYLYFSPEAFWDLPDGVLWAAGFSAPDDLQPLAYQAPLGVTVYSNPDDLPLQEWFNRHSGHPTSDPNTQIYFFDPMAGQVTLRKDGPSMHYVRAMAPQREEILFARPGFVVGVSYASGLEYDYEPAYLYILETLQVTKTQALPSPTPGAAAICLDDQAAAMPTAARSYPLEVWYTSGGDVWLWAEGDLAVQRLTDSKDIQDFWFSPDGSRALLQRWPDKQSAELWVVNRDGSDLRPLILADQVRALSNDVDAWQVVPQVTGWAEDELQAQVALYGVYEGIGGCCTNYGTWTVDVSSGEIYSSGLSESSIGGLRSPDGQLEALVTESSLSITDADGNILHRDVLTYPAILGHEGGWYYYPPTAWLTDGSALTIVMYPQDIFAAEQFTTWRAPVDGSPAKLLHEFQGFPLSASLSPDGSALIYWRTLSQSGNQRELHLANAAGSLDFVYAQGQQVDLLNWSPDGYHFVYGTYDQGYTFLGSLCGAGVPLLNQSGLKIEQVRWLDQEWFLFTNRIDERTRELRLGLVGKDSFLIGKLVGESSLFKPR